ncbi:unnamed protein product [Rhizopus microsporus]
MKKRAGWHDFWQHLNAETQQISKQDIFLFCRTMILLSCCLYSALVYYIIGHREDAEDAVHSKGKKERKWDKTQATFNIIFIHIHPPFFLLLHVYIVKNYGKPHNCCSSL